MKSFRNLLPLFAFVLFLSTTASAKTNTKNGIAVKGHDVVAYFSLSPDQNAVKGDPAIQSTYKGATYYFASQTNKQAFDQNPAQYVPEYGGYCAFGLANGYVVDTDPDAWTVHNGKLYLNLDKKVRSRWDEDRKGFIKKADSNINLLK